MKVRLIDADALMEQMKHRKEYVGRPSDPVCLVEDAPSVADVDTVRHGRYVGTEYDGYADGNPVFYEWICSECECVFEDEEPHYKYCPNCGAKMDGGENDETD